VLIIQIIIIQIIIIIIQIIIIIKGVAELMVPLQDGSALFTRFDGSEVAFTSTYSEPVYPFFVNEVARYVASRCVCCIVLTHACVCYIGCVLREECGSSVCAKAAPCCCTAAIGIVDNGTSSNACNTHRASMHCGGWRCVMRAINASSIILQQRCSLMLQVSAAARSQRHDLVLLTRS
jgi:hypothetical protein